MVRPLRIQFQNGWYHVTARGNNRQRIYLDEREHRHWLELLAGMRERQAVEVSAFVLMDNHYHLLVRTPHGLRTVLTSYFFPNWHRKVFAGLPRTHRALGPDCRAVVVREGGLTPKPNWHPPSLEATAGQVVGASVGTVGGRSDRTGIVPGVWGRVCGQRAEVAS